MLTTLFFLILLFTILGVSYHRQQRGAGRIGGSISQAKAFWLAYVLFNYLGLTGLLVWFLSPDHPGYFGLLLFGSLFLIRGLIQPLMMFKWLNWKPPYGIFSNILMASTLLIFLAFELHEHRLEAPHQYVLPIFLVKLIALLLCDSYYAFVFFRIVGEGTTGEEAIWFAADEDARFESVNRLTFRLNIVFSIISLFFLTFTVIAYG